MLTAVVRTHTADQVVAVHEASQLGGPFFCVRCGARVILRQAGGQSPHFAHVSNTGCRPEPQAEIPSQRLIQEMTTTLANEPAVNDLHQGWLETQRTAPALDFWWDHTQHIAIEVAMGPLPISTISQRTHRHTQAGMAVLWVVPRNNALEEAAISAPMRYERYLNELYRGRLFTWSPEQRLCSMSYRMLSRGSGALKRLHNTYPWILADDQKTSISTVYREVHLHPAITYADLNVVSYPACKSRRMLLPTATLWTNEPACRQQQKGGDCHAVDR